MGTVNSCRRLQRARSAYFGSSQSPMRLSRIWTWTSCSRRSSTASRRPSNPTRARSSSWTNPTGELIARAAKGIEEEVEQGVRIPVGKGFAGRIAAEQRPVVIDDVDHADVLNPILREKGIRSLLGVPLGRARETCSACSTSALSRPGSSPKTIPTFFNWRPTGPLTRSTTAVSTRWRRRRQETGEAADHHGHGAHDPGPRRPPAAACRAGAKRPGGRHVRDPPPRRGAR